MPVIKLDFRIASRVAGLSNASRIAELGNASNASGSTGLDIASRIAGLCNASIPGLGNASTNAGLQIAS